MAISSRGDVGVLLKRLYGLVNPSETYPIGESIQPVCVVTQRGEGMGAGERPLSRRFALITLAGERPCFGWINPVGNRSVAYIDHVWASLTVAQDILGGITQESTITALAGFAQLSPRTVYTDQIGEPGTASPIVAFTATAGITGTAFVLPLALAGAAGRAFPLKVRLEPGSGVIFEATTNAVNTLAATLTGHELLR